MNRIVFLLFNLLISVTLSAQELTVKSFLLANNDLTARTHPRNDMNGNPCGLVKVQIAKEDVGFDGWVIEPVEQLTSEYLVYMPAKSTKLKISCKGFTPLVVVFSDYGISNFEALTTYVLTLQIPEKETVKNKAAKAGHFTTSDLTSFQLHGHVKKVIESKDGENHIYEFDREGKYILKKSAYEVIKRDAKGQLTDIYSNPPSEQFSLDNLGKPLEITGPYNFEYTFEGDIKRFVLEDYPRSTELQYVELDDLGNPLRAHMTYGSELSQVIYSYDKFDNHGNWTLRSESYEGNEFIKKRVSRTIFYYDDFTDEKYCSRCYGVGKVTCPKCEGQGSFTCTDKSCEFYDESEGHGHTCKKCGGDGSYVYRFVEGIEGTGKIACPSCCNKSSQKTTLSNVTAAGNVSVIDKSPLDNQKFTVNGITFTMVAVEGGTFTMGATSEQAASAKSNEKPVHKVTLSDYFIGETEVTQELWQAVMGHNPSKFIDSDKPVEQVSWYDCHFFVKTLSKLTGMQFRLPTEAEWEYAARGGKKSQNNKYSGSSSIDKIAWYYNPANKLVQTMRVKTKLPNELGIYDMSGNVWEWCSDYYDNYKSQPQTNPEGPYKGENHVTRGGSWDFNPSYCRVTFRDNCPSSTSNRSLGLRIAMSKNK